MRTVSLSLLAAAALGIAGCGGSNYKNQPRPATPIDVGAAINQKRITVSPTNFGAGPVVLIITNQSTVSQDVRVRSEPNPGVQSKCPPVDQTTGPINPQDTAELKVDLCEGAYNVRTAANTVKGARLVVGTPRTSAQNQVLQP
ncbi:MAG TPA: hypothetical protein VHE14_04325 [Solirubrobacteraceae bacterium]|nr:hypothetical protein [Solirubrobacteraceae bacterium]